MRKTQGITGERIAEIKQQHLADRETGVRPNFHKGKHVKDWHTCGNCHRIN